MTEKNSSQYPRQGGRTPEEVANAGREHSEHPAHQPETEIDADWKEYVRGSATSKPFEPPEGTESLPNLPGSTNFDDHNRDEGNSK